MPNVKAILVKNYVLPLGSPIQLDDFYAPCIITALASPQIHQQTAVGFFPLVSAIALGNSAADLNRIKAFGSMNGVQFPIRLRRLVGVWAIMLQSFVNPTPPNSCLLTVIGDGEPTDETD